MEVRVKKLFDLSQIKVPIELKSWRVNEVQVQEQLQSLARLSAVERTADCVETGDSVFLSCNSGQLKDRQILLYPGLHLPGAQEAEEAVLGLSVGNEIVVELSGKAQLKIEKIVRRVPAEINDRLIQEQEIENVADVDSYIAWYKETAGEKNKENAVRALKNYFIDAMVQNSEFSFDEEEMKTWVEEQFQRQIALESAETGQEPEISEEEIPEMKAYYRETAFREALEKSICQENGFEFTPDMFDEEVRELTGDLPGMEEMIEEYKAMFVQNAYTDKVMELLDESARKCLEVE